MSSFLNIFFIGNLVYFFLAVFIAFFIPGSLALGKIKLPIFQRFVLSIGTGIVLWSLQGFLFGFIHARYLTYVYILLACLLWIKSIVASKKLRFHPVRIEKLDVIICFIIFSGVLVQLTSVWFVGTTTSKGLFFCCANTKDNLYHLALTNQLIENVPPQEPGMYGIIVHNYHYLGNITVAELVRIFHLPLIQTQFQYMNLLISIFLGLSALAFAQMLRLNKQFYAWLLFFLYFGADLIYLLVSVIRKEVNFSMSSLEDGANFLNNPPRAFSMVLFFIGMSLFTLWVTRKDKRIGWMTAIVFGSLIGFKVYTGYFILAGLLIVALFFLYQRKYNQLAPIILTWIISLLIYLPVNHGAGGFYYTGFAIFENFIVQPWMTLIRLEQARIIYAEHHNILRVIQYECIFMFIYFWSVFGTKMLGIFQTKKSLKLLPKEIHILLLSGMLASLPLGAFFQQKSGGSNSFNFLVSIFIIGSIYTALACYFWLGRTKGMAKYICILAIVLVTLPRIIYNAHSNIRGIILQKGFVITNQQLAALDFLKHHTPSSSVVAVNPKDFIVDYEEAPYISFLTNRREYLAGTAVTKDHGVNMDTRMKVLTDIFSAGRCKDIQNIMNRNGIDYILMAPTNKFICKNTDDSLKLVYSNKSVDIYRR